MESCVLACGEVTVELPRERLLEVCRALRDEPEFGFNQLIDLCGVDYALHGHSEWTTDNATDTGFSRGVEWDFDRAPTSEAIEENPRRFAVVYHLLSTGRNHRLRLRAFVDEARLLVDSVIDIWPAANWYEREAFDLFGILFDGHPDLRRILTDYGFIGHPFRKDFPLSGNVEMRYDPEKQRVVYQPVSIEPRVLGPKVIRSGSRYLKPGQADQSDR